MNSATVIFMRDFLQNRTSIRSHSACASIGGHFVLRLLSLFPGRRVRGARLRLLGIPRVVQGLQLLDFFGLSAGEIFGLRAVFRQVVKLGLLAASPGNDKLQVAMTHG